MEHVADSSRVMVWMKEDDFRVDDRACNGLLPFAFTPHPLLASARKKSQPRFFEVDSSRAC